MTGKGPAVRQASAIRSGVVPAFADGFITRSETAPALAVLTPGTTLVLVSEPPSQPGQPAGAYGKTQLAAHFARTLWRAGQVEVLAWVDASSRASALAGYTQAAAAAGIEVTGPAEQAAARLTGWLAGTTRPWLMVLDDVRDAADLDGLWPRGPAGRVLITTRDEQTIAAIPGELRAQAFGVGAFSSREALNYLMGRLAADPDQRHGAIDLALELGGDPVALTHASAVIITTTQSCVDYQRHYTDLCAHLEAQQARSQPPAPPAVTWILSAERARQLSAGGTIDPLLVLAALLDGQAIPTAMFTTPAICNYLAEAGASAADPDQVWEATRALEHTGLLTIDPAPTPPTARVSRLIAALVRAATSEQVLDRAAVVAADALLEIWPQQERQPWTAVDLRSCADALQQTAANRLWTADACHPLLHKAGHSLGTARLSGPAVRHWAQLTTASDRLLEPEHPHTLATGGHLAHALLAADQASEAAAWWQWVAASHTRICGPRHPSTLTARVNLGRALLATSQPGEAITILVAVAADHERACGPGHPATLHARAELATACQATGRTAEAIEHFRCNLTHHEHAHGDHHLATMTAREHLAAALLADSQLTQAITCYQQVLADRQRVQGPDHLDTITTRRNLATACHTAGNITEALQLHEQVCGDYERILGASHPETLARRADLADLYYAAGRLADAAALRRDTLSRHEHNPAAKRDDPSAGHSTQLHGTADGILDITHGAFTGHRAPGSSAGL